MTQHIPLLVNPTAGGRTALIGTRLLRYLRDRGADVTVSAGHSPEDGARLAHEAVVPAGTGNGIARAFGMPRSVPAVAEAILSGRHVIADTVRVAAMPVTCEVVPGSVRMLTAAAPSHTS